MMKPPSFWFNPPTRTGLWPKLLSPLSWLYAFGTRSRLERGAREKVDVPVIAVGNVNLGGTGKTPTVIAVINLLQQAGRKPGVVTRGYGGSITGPHHVDAHKDRADQTGDEALLLAGFAPVFVSKKRAPGAHLAISQGCDVLILDDALQNPDLHHDLTITVVDAEVGFGNGHVCPSGPLREPVDVALARTDLVLMIGGAATAEDLMLTWPMLNNQDRVRGELKPLITGFSWEGMHLYAFAGIGRPAKFFKSLKAAGANLIMTRSFDDHAPYSVAVLKRMQAEAWAKGANLVTTEKDATRLPPDMRAEVLTFPVRLVLDDPDPLKERLKALGL